MYIREIFEAVTTAWQRKPGQNTRKYRCKSGPRKGRVMASPASCMKPINVKKSAGIKRTKSRFSKQQPYKASLTKRRDPYSRRLRRLNR